MKNFKGTVMRTSQSIRSKAVGMLAVFFCIVAVNQISYGQCSSTAFSVSQTPTVTGTPGAVGTKYKRTNVLPGVDMVTEIVSLNNNVALSNEDSIGTGTATTPNGSGYMDAWQPVITPLKTAGIGGVTWKISFFVNGSTTPYRFNCLSMLAIDIDGDGSVAQGGANSLKEYVEAVNPNKFSGQASGTFLTYSSATNALRTEATTTTTIVSIDSSQKQGMIQYHFTNVTSIIYTVGYERTTTITNNGNRQYCVFFNTATRFTPVFFKYYDTDGDGVTDINNLTDLDDDNDGIPDTAEYPFATDPFGDADSDGLANYEDPTPGTGVPTWVDSNGDNVNDKYDADLDGLINSLDLDSDNDGIPDIVEAGGVDTNGDGLVDGFTDSNGNGLADRYDATVTNGVVIRNLDSDGDLIPNFLDLDSDNDGIPDVVEAGGTDANGDGRIDNFADSDFDGLSNLVDGDANNDGIVENGGAAALIRTGTYISTSNPQPDSYPQGIANDDGRDLPNFIDLDSDDDGISDVTEAVGTDANFDGKADSYVDADGDGFNDTVDGDVNGTINVSKALLATGADTNNDGRPDSYPRDNADGTFRPNPYDSDSDDDGIPDLIEAGGIDSNGGGRVDAPYTDANGNGWLDFYDPTVSGGINLRTLDANGSVAGGLVFDFDGDGKPNYLDLDSDNDGVADIIEQGGTDANNDGKVDYTGTYADNDLDNDGFLDVYDPIDNRQAGSVASGKTCLITAAGPVDATTKLPTIYSLGDNIDNASLINMLDLDADADGLLDTRESGISSGTGTSLDANNDGIVDASWTDGDGDGWADVVKSLPLFTLRNTDGIGQANYLDIDSDDDGIPDNIEAQSTTGYIYPATFMLSGSTYLLDSDFDGINDAYDNNDSAYAGNATNGLSLTDTDGDGISDYRDLDSDNDGKLDRLEGWDVNGNNKIDASEKAWTSSTADADGDGLLDVYDAITQSNTAAYLNLRNSTIATSYPDKNNPGGDRDWREAQDTDKDGIIDVVDLDDDNDGIMDAVECPNCATKVFQNGSFELPVQSGTITTSSSVPGWGTTAQDGLIEIWRNSTPAASDGVQMVELNANYASTLYQNFCLNGNGATIKWSVKHRGRSGTDVASVGFGASAATLTTVATMSDGTTAWGTYTGYYTVPAGVTNLYFGLTAVSTSTGDVTVGNFIDDVQITIIQQAACDADGDGIPDTMDLDSDGDGIPDIVEAGGIDSDGNGTVDFIGTWALVDTDNDGLFDQYDDAETNATVTGALIRNLDSDNDGIPNSKDLDSDNDGIQDVVEARGTDANNDGKLDDVTDTDADGLSDSVDGDVGNDGTAENTNGSLITTGTGTSGLPGSYSAKANADGIGLPNPYDLDSDDDGVPDLIEAGGIDSNGDGRVDATTDANGNGWRDFYDGALTGTKLAALDLNGDLVAGGLVFDFDGDGIPNAYDLDSDNDGIPDIIEQGGTDNGGGTQTNDGKVDGTADVDNDGFIDLYDPINNSTSAALGTAIITATTPAAGNIPTYSTGDNFDGTGLMNMLDLDADGDGILDVREAGITGLTDLTNDGIADGARGADGWNAAANALAALGLRNSDGQGGANYLDIDADDDGITDNIEGQTTAGYVLPLGVDADVDGIDDAYDNVTTAFAGNGTKDITPANKDGVDNPDYYDTDTDNDNISDLKEGWGDPGFSLTIAEQTADADGDGLLDKFDAFNTNSPTSAMQAAMQSNATMKNMGDAGVVPSPLPTLFGSMVRIYKTQAGPIATVDRDWRNATIILPVKLISFTVGYSNKAAGINWTTANEDGNERYLLERSIDGVNFQSISSTASKGATTSSYTYTDNAVPAVNVVYYRLQMVNVDGSVSYSKIVAIRLIADKLSLSIYPNPVVDQVSISFTSTTAQTVNVKVLNMQGASIMAQVYKAQTGTNTLQLNNWSKLPTGDYLIEVSNDNFKMTQKLTHVH